MRTNALFFGRLFGPQFAKRYPLGLMLMMAVGPARSANAVEFTANEQISAANSLYENQPITVNNATLVIDGFHEFETLVIINGGKVTHTVGTTGFHLKVNTSIIIATNASMDVSAKGRGKPGNTGRSGGSYGGRGEDLHGNSNPTYGDALEPKDLGTGGGGDGECYGGGALWIQAPELVLDGQILANGQSGWNYMSGGSGGSILVEVGVLRGGGWMRANGGNGGGNYSMGGGGGRIAVYYDEAGQFNAGQLECGGGASSGGPGTIYVRDRDDRLGWLRIDNLGRGTPGAPTVLELGQGVIQDLKLSPGAHLQLTLTNAVSLSRLEIQEATLNLTGDLTVPELSFKDSTWIQAGKLEVPSLVLEGGSWTHSGQLNISNDLRLLGTARLSHGLGYGGGLHLAVNGLIEVQTNAVIDVSGKGRGKPGNTGRSGGSYGGRGEDLHGNSNPTYGDALEPKDLGTGGGGDGECYGGGALWIQAPELVLEGQLLANGQNGWNFVGGGSGGSILVEVGVLHGSGWMRANGGHGNGNYSVGGGGGRIAVYYDEAGQFNAGQLECGGGASSGGPGTIYVRDRDDRLGWLRIDNLGRGTPGAPTVLELGRGVIQDLDLSPGAHLQLTLTNAVSLSRLKIQGATLNLTGDLTVPQLGFRDSTWIQSGTLEVPSLVLEGGSWTHSGQLNISNELRLLGAARLSHGLGYGGGLHLAVNGQIEVQTNAVIDVSGKGRGKPGNTGRSGGSYGGRGEDLHGNSNPTYGDALEPKDLGTGGGGDGECYGGGALWIQAPELVLEGQLLANGQNGWNFVGGGSGGSILVEVGVLRGSGWMRANGGNGQGNYSVGGGGGRIAVYSDEAGQFNAGQLECGGGASSGGPGTIYVRDRDDRLGWLRIDNLGRGIPGAPTVLELGQGVIQDLKLSPGAHLQLTLTNAASLSRLEIQGATLNLTGDLTVPVLSFKDSTWVQAGTLDVPSLVLEGGSWTHSGQLNISNDLRLLGAARLSHGQGYGGGLHLAVNGQIEVQTNAVIDVSGKGRGKPGNTGRSGGSYGGRGEDLHGNSNPTYGEALEPKDLGTGGGGDAECYGGGALWIEAPELLLEGHILANGQNGWNYMSAGSGGSIMVNVGVLRGGGWMRANGGNGQGNYSAGGGGGRIAVYYADANNFNFEQIESAGGSGGGQGGTVHLGGTPIISWNNKDSLWYDTVQISWTTYSVDPFTIRVFVTASRPGETISVLSGSPIKQQHEWDTKGLQDGIYQIQALFQNPAGEVVSELTRAVTINNSVAWHSGVVTKSETWSSDTVHVVKGLLGVGAGTVLTIEPGTIVKLVKGSQITVHDGGILKALGRDDARIIFTSFADDAIGGDDNLDGGNSIAQPGDWRGLESAGTGQIVLNAFVELRYDQRVHSGTLAADETWSGMALHQVNDYLVVPEGVRLIVHPGAVIKIERAKCITVQAGGQLMANGTVAEPITFTSIRDDLAGGDSNQDGSLTTPAAGDWGWIFANGGRVVLNQCQIRYGAGLAEGGWGPPGDAQLAKGMLKTAGSASMRISNCILAEAFYDGILAWGGEVHIENSICRSMDRAICAHPDSQVFIRNCTLYDNRIGLLVHGGALQADNTIVAKSYESGVQYDFGPQATVSYCNIWAPTHEGYLNYRNTADLTGAQGNISSDPRFKDSVRENFRLGYGSPCIDAADGTKAPALDLIGAPRYTDFRTPNRGVAAANGEYPDQGAFEFAEMAQSKADLAAVLVEGPAVATAGEEAMLTWTVANVGAEPVRGPWHDQVNLALAEGDHTTLIPAGEFLVGQNITLGPGQNYTTTNTVRVPGSITGPHRWHVLVNVHDEVFEGRNRTNNAALSSAPVRLDLPMLAAGGLQTGRFSQAGEVFWYQIRPGAGKDVLVSLDLQSAEGATELFIGRGYMPSRQRFDLRQQEWNMPDTHAVIPGTANQDYYLMVQAHSLPGGAVDFNLSLQEQQFALNAVAPNQIGNMGQVTLKFSGGQLTEQMRFELIDPAGTHRVAQSLWSRDSSTVYATFKFDNSLIGRYHAQVNSYGQVKRIDHALDVKAAVAVPPEFVIVMPAAMRAGRSAPVILEYANAGNMDLVAPLVHAVMANGVFRSPDAAMGWNVEHELLLINPEGPAGIWPPGFRARLALECQSTNSQPQVHLKVSVISEAAEMDWDAHRDDLQPMETSRDVWNVVFAGFKQIAGSTFGEYNRVLAENATFLSRLRPARNALDFQEPVLFGCILRQCNLEQIRMRFYLGAFGRGHPADWETGLRQIETGLIEVWTAGGPSRYFQFQEGRYVNLLGDKAVLDGAGPYQLKDTAGFTHTFNSEGLLISLADNNDNRATFIYEDGRVVRIERSNGEQVQITYNPQGRVKSMAGPAGQRVQYTYDAGGEHLMAETDGHSTVQYAYVAGQGAARDHALASVTGKAGDVLRFEYDRFGRMTRLFYEGTHEEYRWGYGPANLLTITNALGQWAMMEADEDGIIVRTRNSLDQSFRIELDEHDLVTRMEYPGGLTFQMSYDAQDRLVQVGDPLDGRTRRAFWTNGPLTKIAALWDARGNQTRYQYDARGNLVARQFPDGAQVTMAYDQRGNRTGKVDASGRQFQYAFDPRNRLTNATCRSGASFTYAYDMSNNLVRLDQGSAVLRLSYDAAGRPAQIEYPSGRSLQYQYNLDNRRAQMQTPDGSVIAYEYDHARRPTRVTDSGRLALSYEYDNGGQITRRRLGNGGFTTYEYDAVGRIRKLTNYSPSSNVISGFEYTWDQANRLQSVANRRGLWQYRYDRGGQLIEALTPAGRKMAYQYDAAGNRTQVQDDGPTQLYVSNARNQYTRIGAQDCAYDPDGHQTRLGARACAYDERGNLIRVQSPAGEWVYEWDGLGSLQALTVNGQRWEYLIDAAAELGDVVGVYDAAGTLARRYVHGIELALAVEAGGRRLWYYYDAGGNTTEITDDQGNILNEYDYLPFGEHLVANEQVPNPFQFVGALGVMRHTHGLDYMRARFYDPSQGRFIQEDPLGVEGGMNLYAYAQNNPVELCDPAGLAPEGSMWAKEIAIMKRNGEWEKLPPGNGGGNADIRDRIAEDVNLAQVRKAGKSLGNKYCDYVIDKCDDQEKARKIIESTYYVGTGLDVAVGYIPVIGAPWCLGSSYAQYSAGDKADALSRAVGAIPLAKPMSGWWSLLKGQRAVWAFFLAKNSGKIATKIGGKVPKVNQWLSGQSRSESEAQSRVVGSIDPNDIVGPAGYGPARWIAGAITLPYTIHFENVRTASAPAQIVAVTNQLDSHLDWSTFELAQFGFGGRSFNIPPGLKAYQTRVDLRDSLGLWVDFHAALDPATGWVTWRFESLDPNTGWLTEDPFAGFLPPNQNPPEGEGYVSYFIRGRTNTMSGDKIYAKAEIVFDMNDPLATDTIFNSIDRTSPTSQVAPLPPLSPRQFMVSWTGQDNAGIGTFDIYMAKDRGPYELWLAGVTNATASFSGDNGATYAFFSVAMDGVGQREPAPAQPDAWTTIAASQRLQITGATWADRVLTLAIEGLISGQSYVIERSATLRPDDWQSAGQFVATSPTIETVVTLQPNWPAMFFRVHLSAEHP